MKKILLLFLTLLSFSLSQAQYTVISDDSAYVPTSTNALLEVHATNGDKGILVPRLTTAQRTALATTAPADNSLLVYDTDTKTFWYWDGTAWVEMATGGTVTDDQQLTLSNDTLYIEDGNWIYLGGYMDNTDSQTLSISGNDLTISNGNTVTLPVDNDWVISGTNEYSGVSGNVGVGTTTPATKLHVNGSFRLSDGTQATGRILTSDANGTGTWQEPPVQPVINSETTTPYGSDNTLKTITVTTTSATDKVLLLGEFDFDKDGSASYVSLGIWRGGTEIAETSIYATNDADNTVFVQWVDVPGVGTFTYSLMDRAGAGGYTLVYGSMLTAIVFK